MNSGVFYITLMIFRRKRHSWFWPSVGWLFFSFLLYWVSKIFLGSVSKSAERKPKKPKKSEAELDS
jgi:hypothetical protein